MNVILVSGKRCVGKDFIIKMLQTQCKGIHTNSQFYTKKDFCRDNNLSFNAFITDRNYKEKYRKKLIDYYNEKIKDEPHIFDMQVVKGIPKDFSGYIFIDIRLSSQIDFFKQHFDNVITLRINTSDNIRGRRGWKYDEVIDQGKMETDLDDYSFDFVFNNDHGTNNTILELCENIQKMVSVCT